MADDSEFSFNGPDTLRGAVIMLLIGLLATGYGAYDYVQQSEALTNAEEVTAELTTKGVDTDTGGSSSGVDYRPTVRFTYEYDGTSYTSTNVFPTTISPTYDTESEARSVLGGYETGDTVTAYVPPSDPDDAYLKHQSSNAPLLVVGIGLLFVVGGSVSTLNRY
ncbi:uncharacterized protein DUF3592 [Natrinema hispanicum]|uniref:Uncharacterized protein DUF3592 n=1 Tax=Natrinema hispanicum TaxID=392421 RepID=A0A482YAZ8_9EURY|nr:DUF3592 domain-containing protein [Natrinema hispanicum]RZV06028.1 uncharacterized protein DUF3592 [Natrinema hispanicum]